MDRHLLLAIREQSHASSGCQFLSEFFTDKHSIKLTLLTVIAPAEDPIRRGRAHQLGLAMLKDVKTDLVEAGFTADHIATRAIHPKGSNALSILHEAGKGHFDAVVLSHRERIGLDDLLESSMCEDMLKSSSSIGAPPMWLCRRLGQNKKHVLLCTDGSDPSLRMADHTGFMLIKAPDQNVCVLHVSDPAKENSTNAQDILQKTISTLHNAGLPNERITHKIIRARNVARTILQEAETKQFGVVAMGTAGADRGFFTALFTGSVAQKVFDDLTGATLWSSL